MPTIGLVANVYNEVNALPGWLETHLPFFDDVRVYHAGPQGALSNDGTLELLKKWNIPVKFGKSIDEGFGVVRTEAIHWSPCEYVMLLDADERFYPVRSTLTLSGEGTPHREADAILHTYDFSKGRLPDWANIAHLGENLRVSFGNPVDQGARLREILEEEKPDAVVVTRRHWHDFSFRRPTQDWNQIPDWQARIVRNSPDIYYDPHRKMHETLIGASHRVVSREIFFEHFHFVFKRMEERQRGHDIAIYNSIHEGVTPPTYEEYLRSLPQGTES